MRCTEEASNPLSNKSPEEDEGFVKSRTRRSKATRRQRMRERTTATAERPIYLQILGVDMHIYWYVIERKEKSSSSSSSELSCNSTTDRVKRLHFPDSSYDFWDINLFGNNLVVLNSQIYLLGGDQHTVETRTPGHNNCIGYIRLDMRAPMALRKWDVGGGSLMDRQNGGAAIGHDGTIYSVGNKLYKFIPEKNGNGVVYMSKQLPTPVIPGGESTFHYSLLALSEKKLVTYTYTYKVHSNVMVSYDLELDKWELLHKDFLGFWSPGFLLYEDKYLFSFGSQAPEVKYLCEEVPGIYVFDMERRQWLSKPVQGLLTDETVLPTPFTPAPSWDWAGDTARQFSPYLFQIGKEEKEYKFALLWDLTNTIRNRMTLVWAKFILNYDEDNQDAPFYATSVSSGSCELDENTFKILNCAAGI